MSHLDRNGYEHAFEPKGTCTALVPQGIHDEDSWQPCGEPVAEVGPCQYVLTDYGRDDPCAEHDHTSHICMQCWPRTKGEGAAEDKHWNMHKAQLRLVHVSPTGSEVELGHPAEGD